MFRYLAAAAAILMILCCAVMIVAPPPDATRGFLIAGAGFALAAALAVLARDRNAVRLTIGAGFVGCAYAGGHAVGQSGGYGIAIHLVLLATGLVMIGAGLGLRRSAKLQSEGA